MRFIDLDLLLTVPEMEALLEAADRARGEAEALGDVDARREYLDQRRAVWTAFRPCFESVFGAKCWYTESENPGTDDDIDHFRPKGRVAECREHGGYWWEAFNWRNLRLSCHRANRLRGNPETGRTQGKGDHFPVVAEEERWMTPEEPCLERPILLDPTDPADPPLVTFSPDGRVALSSAHVGTKVLRERFETSRIHLHLDWPRFVEDRRNLYVRILGKILEGDRANKAFSRGSDGGREWLKTVSRELIRMASSAAPYSRAASAYVRCFRDRSWVNQNVIPHVQAEPAP